MPNRKNMFPYVHGFSKEEQDRLRKQAEFGEYIIFRDVDFSSCNHVLEVGCGVGAKTEILLRRFPNIQLSGIDVNDNQVTATKTFLEGLPHFQNRYTIQKMDASNMEFQSNTFDGAFICWVLEHVPDPIRVLSEARRVLKPGSRIYVTEVMNSSFFLDPYSPNVWKYWMSFNDYQYDGAGDPFIGAKLGNLLTAVGYQRVKTNIITWHFDNRHPGKRKTIIEYWMEMLLSAANQLIEAKYTTAETVGAVKKELKSVQNDPNAVFMYSFMQASGVVLNGD